MDSPHYLALLGKSYSLAAYELTAVLNRHNATAKVFHAPYVYEIDGDINPSELIAELGGTVKIYSVLNVSIAQKLANDNQDHFCISSVKRNQDLNSAAKEVKAELKEKGIKPHFRLLEDPFFSAGIINKYAEFCLIPHEGTLIIAEAVAVQNLNYWSQKDYGRPAFDSSSGMLPPKVARMMINSALPNAIKSDQTVYDPMCGSGTILQETLDLGLKALGSDLSQKAVDATIANNEWFISKYKNSGVSKVFQSDATHVKLHQIGSQVDAIVFEGYLGPPHMEENDVPNLIKGLEKLYKGVLKNLYPLLKSNCYLICALPEYDTRSSVKNLDDLVDWSSTLGYTRLNRFTYGRHQAFVKRAIYVLQKTGK